MADKSNDPVAMWQNMIGEMEKGFNSFANQAMASPEFSKVVNQVGGVTAGAQKQLGDLMEKGLRRGLVLSDGSIAPFLTRPISAVIWITIVAVILWKLPATRSLLRRLVPARAA